MNHRASSLFTVWVSQWILWLVLADNYGLREISIGALAASLVTFFAALFARKTSERYEFRMRYFAQAVHIPMLLLTDTWTLLIAIKRSLLGSETASGIVGVPFGSGGDDAAARTRRAIAITYLTLTPNTVVLGISKHLDLLFFHALLPRPVPAFLKSLGSEPRPSS
jgi:multisubunit Na+/H+ antiporter MnhE subunit